MKLSSFRMLADENIDADVIDFLRSRGLDVQRSIDVLTAGASDQDILAIALQQERLVLTHDRDFGALVFAAKDPFYAILYLRPGHLPTATTIDSLKTLLSENIELHPPCIVVCERSDSGIQIRIRHPII